MEQDILTAIKAACIASSLSEKDMAWAIQMALSTLARQRPGPYGTDRARLVALAEEFEEFSR